MELSSTAFATNTRIPDIYTCQGQNISPPLHIVDVPEHAVSLAMIMHDPDAPVAGGFTHWVVWNIPPDSEDIAENDLPDGTQVGTNSRGQSQYRGPCPPPGHGIHHYQFRLYALDTVLEVGSPADKAALEHAIQGHILAQSQLVGLYSRN